MGNLLSQTDPLSKMTSFAYDNLYRRTGTTDPLSGTTSFTYDAVSNLVSLADPVGNTTSWIYDELNRATQETNELNDSRFFEYDAVGNLIKSTDRNGRVREFSFDNLHRMTQERWPSEWGYTINYTFDAADRLTGAADTQAVYGFTYDNLDRRTQVSHDLVGVSAMPVVVTNSTYDGAGRRTTLSAQIGGVDDFVTDYSYDALHRMTGIEQHSVTGGNAVADKRINFTNTDQLTGATYDYQSDEGYTYDANGNRTNTGYTTGTNHRLLSDGTYNFEYDAEGNRTKKKTEIASGAQTTYSWDHRNRLAMVSEADSTGTIQQTFRYGYDAFDQRIWKLVSDTVGSQTESFIYDGLRPERGNAGDHLLLRFDDAGSLSNRYVHGPAIDQILADEQIDPTTGNRDTVWPLTDNLGTVRDLADFDDLTGLTSVANHIVYDSFGKQVSESNAAVDHLFGYTGREWDADVDLQYNRARWYDREQGRWISNDPIGFNGDPSNQYRYVENQVATYTDPSGLRGNGHHIIPRHIFNGKVSPAVQEFFDSDAARIFNDFYKGHNTKTLNGVSHFRFNQLVKERLKDFLGDQELKNMTVDQAKKFLGQIKCDTGDIGTFLKGVRVEAAAAALRLGLRKALEKGSEEAVEKAMKEAGEWVVREGSDEALGKLGREGAEWLTSKGLRRLGGPLTAIPFVAYDAATTPYDENDRTVFGPRTDHCISQFWSSITWGFYDFLGGLARENQMAIEQMRRNEAFADRLPHRTDRIGPSSPGSDDRSMR